MAANPGRADAIGVDELRSLETSVLKALCLTINTAGSELKYKILDGLSDEDFYFPVLRAIFGTLSEMHVRGDYVISANLEEELHKAGADIPLGFSIEQLFDGTLPSLTELTAWVARLKERSRSGLVPTVQPPVKAPLTPPPMTAEATVVKPLADVKKKIAEELRKSSPALPPAPVAPAEVKSSPRISAEKSQPAVAAPPPVAKPKPSPTPAPREISSPAVSPPKPKPAAVLSSEGDDWSEYLQDLAAQQGQRFNTGFALLDEKLGGLTPGLMLLVDDDRDRIASFLKQVTDQIAGEISARCLFVASQLKKSALRLRTLARLAGIPIQDIEKGRLKKDSPEWKRIDSAGRGAADWLRRVFVFESEEEIELALVRDLAKKLLESSDDPKCLVVIDAFEKLAGRGGTASRTVSQLKALADSLDVLILAATIDPTLLAARDADYASVFRETPLGQVELEVLRAGKESSTVVRFHYEPDFCRFSEA